MRSQTGRHPFWGEDIILNAPSLRDRKPAAALTYVEVATLTREDLDVVLEAFPASQEVVRRAASYIGVRRALVVVADYIKVQQSRETMNGVKMPDKLRKKGLGKRCQAQDDAAKGQANAPKLSPQTAEAARAKAWKGAGAQIACSLASAAARGESQKDDAPSKGSGANQFFAAVNAMRAVGASADEGTPAPATPGVAATPDATADSASRLDSANRLDSTNQMESANAPLLTTVRREQLEMRKEMENLTSLVLKISTNLERLGALAV